MKSATLVSELIDRRLAGNLIVHFSVAAQSSGAHVLEYSHPIERDIVPEKPPSRGVAQ